MNLLTEDELRVENDPVRENLKKLTLSNDAIWKREASRPEVQAPWIIKLPYLVLCLLLDKLFEGNPISRFYFLETVLINDIKHQWSTILKILFVL